MCIYIYIYIYVYANTYVYIYIYIYVYTLARPAGPSFRAGPESATSKPSSVDKFSPPRKEVNV